MPRLETNRVRLFYESSGRGPAILFPHGASWDHRQRAPQVAAFHQRYDVIVWDVRGHGESTLPAGPVDANDFSRDLIAVLDHLGISQATFCGLSMGGHISLQTAARYPGRVKALILIGTPFTNTYNWYERLFVPVNRRSSRFVPMPLFAWSQARMLSRHNPAIRAYIDALSYAARCDHCASDRLREGLAKDQHPKAEESRSYDQPRSWIHLVAPRRRRLERLIRDA